MSLRGAGAIIGFAELPTQRSTPGRSSFGLIADATRAAVKDAHIRLEDIDGIVTEGDSTFPAAIVEYLGLKNIRYGSGTSMMGASGATATTLAALAVANGLANYVLVPFGFARNPAIPAAFEGGPSMNEELEQPFGPSAGANTGYALMYVRHMAEYGTTQEQLAHIAANQRFNALENPNSAFKGQPITVEDVLKSRYVNYPLRLLECVMPCGGAAAIIVTSAERAKFSYHPPVYLLGSGFGVKALAEWQMETLTTTPVARSAPTAFAMSGYTPRDIQFAEFYDCYTILEAMCLEDAGICPKGEIGPFFASTDTTYKGTFPINTDGGQLSGGQPNLAGGFRHVVEGV
ncbi:MAG: thiolase family protein, partial [SAR202 cluster bacterium]|nr:thiolase family protein [SAR202 cluster bacterium]